MFGVGSVPIASYFGLPQGASADTRFSPQARGMLAQGEEYAREQAAMDAERAAEELLGGAADMTDEEIQGQLTQNPRMFGTQAIQPLSGYMQFRQSTTPQTDVTLGPILREKIQDPYHREQFEKRMLEGASANDAFDAYRTDEYNMKFETALAEAGVPETEYAKLKTPSGKFIPSAVARAQAASKAAAKLVGTGKKVEPIDIRIETLREALEERKKRLEARGEDLTKDERYKKLADELDTVYDEKLVGVRPPVAPINPANQPGPDGVIKRVAPGVARPPVDIEANSDLLPEEKVMLKKQAVQQTEKDKAQAVIDNEIASAWTKQKSAVQKDIEKQYSKKDLLSVAKGILRGAAAPGATPLTAEGEPTENYLSYLLKKIGRVGGDPAFTEPQNKRWGTQVVTNTELLREWAEQYAAENGGQKAASVPTSSTAAPLTELLPP
jgi:hypothetical protein